MSKITYFDVAKQCNEMNLMGDKPSVRKIRNIIGGSFTTINEYLNQWRREKDLAKDSEMEISHELQTAIQAEFANIAKRVHSDLKNSIDEKTSDLNESLEELEKITKRSLVLEKQLAQLQKTLDDERLKFEKQISANESTISYLSNAKQELHTLLSEANKLKHEAELREVAAKTKADALEKQMSQLTKNNKN